MTSQINSERLTPSHSRSRCPYWESLHGGPPATCNRGCSQEPACIVNSWYMDGNWEDEEDHDDCDEECFGIHRGADGEHQDCDGRPI
ncbi:hypothetical protein [Kitasatospora sp. NPDC001175]|uniref:hypothetical protein n=1 Tax=Kitasatospora sp. NPDC001175 TaxID=3157103 RepID=UPI003D06BF6B